MNIFKTVFDGIGAAVDNVMDAVDQVAADAREALPTSEQVRHAVGDVLIIGGKALGELIKPSTGE